MNYTKYKKQALVIAVYLGTFMASLDISIVNVALPALRSSFNSSLSELQWVINAYAIPLSAFMLSASSWSSKFGLKKVWLWGVLLFTLSSLGCALAPSFPLLLVSRTLQGIAGAILIPGAMSILSHAFQDLQERARLIGGWSAFSALALITGPGLGGILVDTLGWPSIFLINLPIGILALSMGIFGLKEIKVAPEQKLNLMGQFLSIASLALASFSLIKAGEKGFANFNLILSFASAIIIFIIFYVRELSLENPLLNFRLFKNIDFLISNFCSLVLGFSAYSSLFFFSIYFQDIQSLSPSEAGLKMLPQFIFTGFVSILFSRFSAKFGKEASLSARYLFIAIGLFLMSQCKTDTPYLAIFFFLSLLGIGMGLAVPGTGLLAMASVKEELFSMASATMNFLRQAGMAMGIAILGAFMNLKASDYFYQSLADTGIDHTAKLMAQAGKIKEQISSLGLSDGLYSSAMNKGYSFALLLAAFLSLLAFLVSIYTLRQKNKIPLDDAILKSLSQKESTE